MANSAGASPFFPRMGAPSKGPGDLLCPGTVFSRSTVVRAHCALCHGHHAQSVHFNSIRSPPSLWRGVPVEIRRGWLEGRRVRSFRSREGNGKSSAGVEELSKIGKRFSSQATDATGRTPLSLALRSGADGRTVVQLCQATQVPGLLALALGAARVNAKPYTRP